jgi:predicted transcriptional regulator
MRQTSIETYHQIKEEGLLSKLRLAVYEVLYQHGPLSTGEIFKEHMQSFQQSCITPRIAELVTRGVVEKVGERDCRTTGRNFCIWDVTSSLPKQPVRKADNEATQIIRDIRNNVSAAFMGNDLARRIDKYLTNKSKSLR